MSHTRHLSLLSGLFWGPFKFSSSHSSLPNLHSIVCSGSSMPSFFFFIMICGVCWWSWDVLGENKLVRLSHALCSYKPTVRRNDPHLFQRRRYQQIEAMVNFFPIMYTNFRIETDSLRRIQCTKTLMRRQIKPLPVDFLSGHNKNPTEHRTVTCTRNSNVIFTQGKSNKRGLGLLISLVLSQTVSLCLTLHVKSDTSFEAMFRWIATLNCMNAFDNNG